MWVADVRWAGVQVDRHVASEGPVVTRGAFNTVQALADWPGQPGNRGFTAAANKIGDELLALTFTEEPTRSDPHAWSAPPLEVRVYHDGNARPTPPPATLTVYEARERERRMDAGLEDPDAPPPPRPPTGGYGAAIARLFGGHL